MVANDILQTILKDSNYNLLLFSAEEIETLRAGIFTKTAKNKEIAFIKCVIRNKEIQLKSEEIVRQLYATRLIGLYGHPKKNASRLNIW